MKKLGTVFRVLHVEHTIAVLTCAPPLCYLAANRMHHATAKKDTTNAGYDEEHTAVRHSTRHRGGLSRRFGTHGRAIQRPRQSRRSTPPRSHQAQSTRPGSTRRARSRTPGTPDAQPGTNHHRPGVTTMPTKKRKTPDMKYIDAVNAGYTPPENYPKQWPYKPGSPEDIADSAPPAPPPTKKTRCAVRGGYGINANGNPDTNKPCPPLNPHRQRNIILLWQPEPDNKYWTQNGKPIYPTRPPKWIGSLHGAKPNKYWKETKRRLYPISYTTARRLIADTLRTVYLTDKIIRRGDAIATIMSPHTEGALHMLPRRY